MPTITDETLAWARDAFEEDVAGYLDALVSILEAERGPAAKVAELRRIAADLGVDFDAVVERRGTPGERRELRRIAGLSWHEARAELTRPPPPIDPDVKARMLAQLAEAKRRRGWPDPRES